MKSQLKQSTAHTQRLYMEAAVSRFSPEMINFLKTEYEACNHYISTIARMASRRFHVYCKPEHIAALASLVWKNTDKRNRDVFGKISSRVRSRGENKDVNRLV
jgi:hypothetical protein